MPAPNKTKKSVMNIRHSEEVKQFADQQASINNDFPSAFYRKVFNAGLEALYNIKIEGNKIVELPPPRC
jgi:hypothetical protein